MNKLLPKKGLGIFRLDFNWQSGQGLVYDQRWYQADGIQLHQYHLPLLSALSFNAECELNQEDLDPFLDGLRRGDTEVPIVVFVTNWLADHIDQKTSLATIISMVDDIGQKHLKPTQRPFAQDYQKKSRLLLSLKRFMVPGRNYPWDNDVSLESVDSIGIVSTILISFLNVKLNPKNVS